MFSKGDRANTNAAMIATVRFYTESVQTEAGALQYTASLLLVGLCLGSWLLARSASWQKSSMEVYTSSPWAIFPERYNIPVNFMLLWSLWIIIRNKNVPKEHKITKWHPYNCFYQLMAWKSLLGIVTLDILITWPSHSILRALICWLTWTSLYKPYNSAFVCSLHKFSM